MSLTYKPGCKKAAENTLKKLNKDGWIYKGYAAAISWGEQMEELMKDGTPLSDCALRALHNVKPEWDPDELRTSVVFLILYWEHGQELQKWYKQLHKN